MRVIAGIAGLLACAAVAAGAQGSATLTSLLDTYYAGDHDTAITKAAEIGRAHV